MKRLAIIIVFTLMIASVFVSCKTSEHCPAYGSIATQETSQRC